MDAKQQGNSVEIEAGSLEEAIQKAIEVLGVKRQEVSIKVLNEEQKGLFGMEGANPTKIKVTIKKK
ncbi:MAG: Jag N-terminal domain-containing protein [Candidatus Omnitrophota bacterium]